MTTLQDIEEDLAFQENDIGIEMIAVGHKVPVEIEDLLSFEKDRIDYLSHTNSLPMNIFVFLDDDVPVYEFTPFKLSLGSVNNKPLLELSLPKKEIFDTSNMLTINTDRLLDFPVECYDEESIANIIFADKEFLTIDTIRTVSLTKEFVNTLIDLTNNKTKLTEEKTILVTVEDEVKQAMNREFKVEVKENGKLLHTCNLIAVNKQKAIQQTMITFLMDNNFNVGEHCEYFAEEITKNEC